jgi:hypothetical protein
MNDEQIADATHNQKYHSVNNISPKNKIEVNIEMNNASQ